MGHLRLRLLAVVCRGKGPGSILATHSREVREDDVTYEHRRKKGWATAKAMNEDLERGTRANEYRRQPLAGGSDTAQRVQRIDSRHSTPPELKPGWRRRTLSLANATVRRISLTLRTRADRHERKERPTFRQRCIPWRKLAVPSAGRLMRIG